MIYFLHIRPSVWKYLILITPLLLTLNIASLWYVTLTSLITTTVSCSVTLIVFKTFHHLNQTQTQCEQRKLVKFNTHPLTYQSWFVKHVEFVECLAYRNNKVENMLNLFLRRFIVVNYEFLVLRFHSMSGFRFFIEFFFCCLLSCFF